MFSNLFPKAYYDVNRKLNLKWLTLSMFSLKFSKLLLLRIWNCTSSLMNHGFELTNSSRNGKCFLQNENIFQNNSSSCHISYLKKSYALQSSNINEVIRTILDFFIQKFHEHKKHKTLTSE